MSKPNVSQVSRNLSVTPGKMTSRDWEQGETVDILFQLSYKTSDAFPGDVIPGANVILKGVTFTGGADVSGLSLVEWLFQFPTGHYSPTSRQVNMFHRFPEGIVNWLTASNFLSEPARAGVAVPVNLAARISATKAQPVGDYGLELDLTWICENAPLERLDLGVFQVQTP
jgi:hypothetical protein